jgi:hypothetical protein
MESESAEHTYSPLITCKIPLDEEGYVQAFSIDEFDPQAVLAFYQKYGVVVFNDVLSKEEVERSVRDLWVDEETSSHGHLSRGDPETWKYVGGQLGFVNHKPIVQPQLCKNRSHPKVYKAFKTLYQLTSSQEITEPLLALFDRGSILKPSKDHPEWKSPPIYHFDIHPWWWTGVEPCEEAKWRCHNKYHSEIFEFWLGEGNYVPKVGKFTKLQGVLGLSATNPESGGFECVCGFHNYIEEWCRKQKEFTNIEECPELLANMQKIYQRPGSVILFTR